MKFTSLILSFILSGLRTMPRSLHVWRRSCQWTLVVVCSCLFIVHRSLQCHRWGYRPRYTGHQVGFLARELGASGIPRMRHRDRRASESICTFHRGLWRSWVRWIQGQGHNCREYSSFWELWEYVIKYGKLIPLSSGRCSRTCHHGGLMGVYLSRREHLRSGRQRSFSIANSSLQNFAKIDTLWQSEAPFLQKKRWS